MSKKLIGTLILLVALMLAMTAVTANAQEATQEAPSVDLPELTGDWVVTENEGLNVRESATATSDMVRGEGAGNLFTVVGFVYPNGEVWAQLTNNQSDEFVQLWDGASRNWNAMPALTPTMIDTEGNVVVFDH